MKRFSNIKSLGLTIMFLLSLVTTMAIQTLPSRAVTPGAWTLVGLNQYTLNSMAVDPTDPNVLYAGTTGYGIFKSTDKGANWESINNGIDNLSIHTFFALVVDPNNSNILYAGGGELQGGGAGIFKSTDGGANWTIVNNGIVDVGFNGPPSFVHSMVIDPNNSNILYVALGVHCGAVYKTTDAAASWTRTGAACDPVALTLDPSNSNIIYASADGGVVWKSTDAAQTWDVVSSSSFNTLPIDPFNTNVLYGSKHGGGAYKSVDGGASWAALNSPSGIYRGLITDPIRPDTLFLGQLFTGNNKAYISRDGGASWTDTGGTWSGTGPRFLVRPANDNNVLYALTDAGLYSYGIVDPTPTFQAHGTVYEDTNNNGVKDAGEQGYQGATVHLYAGLTNWQIVNDQAVTTDANGNYSITIPSGTTDEWLRIDAPDGYQGTTIGIYGFGNSDTTHDFGIKSTVTLPAVFADNFTDNNGTTLAAHNSAWSIIEQGMPVTQNDTLTFPASSDPFGPAGYVMTDQCMTTDFQSPTVGIIAQHARQAPNGSGGYKGYGSDLNTDPTPAAYSISLYRDQTYIGNNMNFPKAIVPNGMHTLRFCVIGQDLSVYLDGALLDKASDATYTQGFVTYGVSSGNILDNFKLEGVPAGPPVYAVSTNSKSISGNNNIVATVGSTGIPAGDTANVSVATGTFAGAVGCTDSKGNTYTVAADRNSGQGRLFVCTSHLTNALAAGDTVTATYPGFSGVSVISLNAISALATNGTVLAANQANGNSATPNSGSITTSGPTVLFGVIANNSTPTFTPGTNYTLVGQATGGSGSLKRTVSPEFQIVNSGGIYGATGTISNGGQFWQAAIVGYAGQ